jgi:hypothetical protein
LMPITFTRALSSKERRERDFGPTIRGAVSHFQKERAKESAGVVYAQAARDQRGGGCGDGDSRG